MGMRATGTDLLATLDQVDQSTTRSSTYRLVYFRHGRSNVQYTTDRGRGSRKPTLETREGGGQGMSRQDMAKGRTEKKKKKKLNGSRDGRVHE